MKEGEPIDINSGNLNEVKRIERFFGLPISRPEQIAEIVEEPLVQACQILYHKNIQTLGSGANLESEHPAFIYLNWQTLSEENRAIAHKMGLVAYEEADSEGNSTWILDIRKKINPTDSINDVSNYFVYIADQFLEQEPTWVPKYTLDDLKQIYGFKDGDDVPVDYFPDYTYDPGTDLFYSSPDHLAKVKKWETLKEAKTGSQ